MSVITISRQCGSGGDEIARFITQSLDYRYFDKNLMAQVASQIGYPQEKVVDFPETNYRTRGFFERLLDNPRIIAEIETWQPNTAGAQRITVAELDEQQCIQLVQSCIYAAAQLDRVIILGRGGQAVLKDQPGVLHVRVEAPLAKRIMRIQETENLSLSAAKEWALTHDKFAAAYLKRFYHLDWSDPLHYHLVLNTGHWEIKTAAQLVISALNHLNQ
ncbi:MAG: cytidylate kinase-like family protein [Chloroflexota bacterium]|nr:cytidylate kinase-like family protein [Chloroflexota bacterium]